MWGYDTSLGGVKYSINDGTVWTASTQRWTAEWVMSRVGIEVVKIM